MYVAGINQDSFTGGPYASQADALNRFPREAGLKPGDSFYLGRPQRYRPEIPGTSLVAALQDVAQADMGRVADGWLARVPDEHVRELGQLVSQQMNRWIERRGLLPDFYTLDETELHIYQP